MSTLIPKSFIQDVIARTDIVAIISARIELKKRGSTHMACCPFHHEKTPSFTVSETKQFYYCFGCGAHGDVIKFLTEYDHLTFIDAVTDLAQQLGLPIPRDIDDTNTTQNAALYDVLHRAQGCYEKALKQAPNAIAYLKSRGLTGDIAKKFGLGFAPSGWDFLLKSINAPTDLLTAGMLIEKSPGRYYDRFRDRVLFPIRDVRGRTIGFGGRTMTDETPKYLNSPETPVFHKHQTLYGLYEAYQHSRTLKRALVVEGYLDVISLAQHGIHYGVATLGTALNIKHIQLLLRYTQDIIFCFDGDAAGQKAALKSLTISLPLLRDGLNFRFLFLTNKEDPDSLIRKIGHEAFEKLIDQATPLSEVFFDELAKTHNITEMAGKAAFAKAANDLINTMPDGIYKNLLLDQLANKLSIARDKITKAPTPEINHFKKTTRVTHTQLNPATTAIQLLLQTPTLCEHITHTYSDETSVEKKLLTDLIKWCQKDPTINVGELLSSINDEATRTLIASIATLPLHIPEEGRPAELMGALQRLQEQENAQERSKLIEKARVGTLDNNERARLQTLLAEKHMK
jgi:DNA primase